MSKKIDFAQNFWYNIFRIRRWNSIIKLDYTLETPEERVALVEKILAENPENIPTTEEQWFNRANALLGKNCLLTEAELREVAKAAAQKQAALNKENKTIQQHLESEGFSKA